MNVTLRYGENRSVRLDVPSEALLAQYSGPRGAPIADPGAVLTAALLAPLDFPPLAQATVPGDRVVLALGEGVPQAPSMIAAVVAQLIEAGIEAEDITVLWTRAAAESGVNDPRSELPREQRAMVNLQVHNPSDRGQLSYLAAGPDGTGIYLNRCLFDADFVLPIGCARLGNTLGYHGMNSLLYPAFSDTKAIERSRGADLGAAKNNEHPAQPDEVAWLLGVLFSIQVVPGAGEEVLYVVAGESRAVRREAERLTEAAWSFSAPKKASLVVAAVEGSAAQQTWENVARALATASQLVTRNGAIAVCTELAAGPGPALQRLVGAEDLHEALREIRKDRAVDALPAAQLVDTLEHARVYLLSQLDEEIVEDMGLAHVGEPEEIARLAERHKSCIVVGSAQHVHSGAVAGFRP